MVGVVGRRYKRTLKQLERDRQTDRQTHKTTTVTLRRACAAGLIIVIGERSEPPLSVELSEFSLYLYIYIYIYLYIYIFQAVRRARAINALCANVYTSDWPVEVQWSI